VVEPALTAITPIDFDHEVYLGHTIQSIAGEKAGILKPGVPAVFARQRSEARAVLDQRAAQLNVPVRYAEDFEIRDLVIDARGSRFSGRVHPPGGAHHIIDGRGSRFSGLICPLAGEHQVDNAVTAALSLTALNVDPRGIQDARWPGRLEHVAPNPDIILDGAHNPAGARALARYIERFYADHKLHLIFGAMRDKSIEEIAGILFPLAQDLLFTAPDNPRAVRPEALADIAGRGEIAATVAEAIDLARARASADDMILITGSLFLAGEARAIFSGRR
jgi:dihydrofolate synthase/folylpolyglutamate synthase